MTVILSQISVAEAATIINALVTFVQFTLSLSLVVVLVHFMPKTNSALAWSSISRALHSTFWPTILNSESNSSGEAGAVASAISPLSFIGTVLIAIAGVTLPLGLQEGPLVPSNPRIVASTYMADPSPLGAATTPNRHNFQLGRRCGATFGAFVPCPGNGGNSNITTYSPSIVERFGSTPHSPFAMQYRRFFNGKDPGLSTGLLSTSQSFILREDTFVIEGLIVDMSSSHPGIGFWNQTVPNIPNGGTWTIDILWLEPATECVDTNLTLDYFLTNGADSLVDAYNLTDHGGFYNITSENPSLDRDGQHINLREHAYKGASLSNLFAMNFLNVTRDSTFEGKSYPLNITVSTGLTGFDVNKIVSLPLSYLNKDITGSLNLEVLCSGYGGQDTANVTNVQVQCGVLLGPPLRTDGGNPRTFDSNSKWRQGIHVCASATRASIQRTTFSMNDTSNLANIRVTREPTNSSILWGVEKTDMKIVDIDLMWGRVDEIYENDPSLWTIPGNNLYLPAGSSAGNPGLTSGAELPSGLPSAAHGVAWFYVYDDAAFAPLADYTGDADYAMKTKFQQIIQQNSIVGPAQIRNLMWTDVMANNVVGSNTSPTLLVAQYRKSLKYDFRFAIPGFVLLMIWMPAFIVAIVLLVARKLTFDYIRDVLNHTSVGRAVVGPSALRVQEPEPAPETQIMMPEPNLGNDFNPYFVDLPHTGPGDYAPDHRSETSDWAHITGLTLVTLELDRNENSTDNKELRS